VVVFRCLGLFLFRSMTYSKRVLQVYEVGAGVFVRIFEVNIDLF